MRRTWHWLLAIDSAALRLLALDRVTRSEVLTKLETDLPALVPCRSEAAEFIDQLKARVGEIGLTSSSGVWWEKRGYTRGPENQQETAPPLDRLTTPAED